ncbi:MAG: aldo/keto reductase [Ramlibacter sp.]
MEYVRLGRTGTKVSRICLGCMTFGEPNRGRHPWTMGAEQSRPIIRHALEAGINFFDTANSYSDGSSEEIVGAVRREYAKRDELVIATKVFNRMRPGPNGAGLSRKAILHEIDQSLKRLGTDYVDLYQIHRWDPGTPIEETLEALHTSERRHLTRFVTMQNHLNLLYREEEREMLPLCRDEGIGVLPWSPLARGRLARPWGQATPRIESDDFGHQLYDATEQADRAVAERVAQVAAQRGVPMAQVALAWVAQHPGVTAPIVGASKPQHVDDAVAALKLDLSPEETALLEAPYVPHAIAGQ